jgi:DNA-directed RNA polymerase subunit RPC12/RpoP
MDGGAQSRAEEDYRGIEESEEMTIYWCSTCNKVAKPYHGDPGKPTCWHCYEELDEYDSEVVLKLAKYLEELKK